MGEKAYFSMLTKYKYLNIHIPISDTNGDNVIFEYIEEN